DGRPRILACASTPQTVWTPIKVCDVTSRLRHGAVTDARAVVDVRADLRHEDRHDLEVQLETTHRLPLHRGEVHTDHLADDVGRELHHDEVVTLQEVEGD